MMNGTICNSTNNHSCEVNNYYEIFTDNPYDYWFVFLCLASLLGIIGNGLVIWFCLFRMEKTVNVIWFLSLSIADFMFALFLSFMIVYRVFLRHGSHSLDMLLITLLVSLVNMVVSVFQLTVISVDRCICVIFPVWCRNHRTRRLALIVVLIIWIFSISSSFINLSEFFVSGNDYTWIAIVRFLLFFLLPFVVIISSYTILILRIKGKSIIKSSRPFKIIIALVIAFFVCWFPYYLFVLFIEIQYMNTNILIDGMKISLCLMFLNCCINPILYVFIGQDFKQKCCGSFQAVLEKVFREDMGQMNFTDNQQCSSSGLVLTPTNTSVI